MSSEQIAQLIVRLAAQGKNRQAIVSELIHQGFSPQEVEAGMDSAEASGKLPESFWKNGSHSSAAGEADVVLQTENHTKKNVIISAIVVVCVAAIAFFGWSWYNALPRVTVNRAYDSFSRARSFEFIVQAFGAGGEEAVRAEGIAVVRSKPGISLQTQSPMFSLIRREGGPIFFRTETADLGQYAWIEAEMESLYSQSYLFDLDAVTRRLGAVKLLDEEAGDLYMHVLDRIIHAPIESATIDPPAESLRGVQLLADPVYKRQLAELVMGPDDSTLLDELSVSQWHLFGRTTGPKGYVLLISPNADLLADQFSSVMVTFQNLNAHEEIPFDSATTPFENIIQWRQGM